MSDKIKVAEAIERQAKTYQAIIDAAAMLKEIGSLEQARDEIVKSHLAATDEALAAKLELKNTKDEVKKIKDKIIDQMEQAKSDVDAVIAEANKQATGIVNDALKRADAVEADARATADRTVAGVEARRSAIANDVDALVAKSEGLDLDIKAKLAEVEAIEARLAKAQAQIAKYLG